MTKIRFPLSRGLVAAILFVVFVAVSGVALANAGYMENPFRVVAQLTGTTGEGREGSGNRGSRGEFQPPSQSTGSATGTAGTANQTRGEGGVNNTSLNRGAVGSVLYNLWFIAAATAFVMIVGRPVGYLFKQLQERLPGNRRRVPAPTISGAV